MDFRSLIPFAMTGSADRGLDPFLAFRRDMERMMGDFGRAAPEVAGFLSPKVDVMETEAGIEIHAELPGIEPKDIDLELENGVLSLRAEKLVSREEKDEKKTFHLVERAQGTFLRRFQLPFQPDEGGVQAAFDKGILTVRIARPAEAKSPSTKIPVG